MMKHLLLAAIGLIGCAALDRRSDGTGALPMNWAKSSTTVRHPAHFAHGVLWRGLQPGRSDLSARRRSRRHLTDVFEYFRTERKTPSLQSRSIEGAGIFSLGGNQLITGFNNLSTSVSGTITGDGSLIKTGSGTLTLSGHQHLYRRDHGEWRRADRGRLDRLVEPDDGEQRRARLAAAARWARPSS